MIDNLNEAIANCHETAEELRNNALVMIVNGDSQEEREAFLECAEEYDQLAELLEELKARREADRWIPVSERLPEEGNTTYLTTVDYGNGVIASCQRFFFNDEIGWNDDSVIAWKPLPKPYESEGE